jgi:stress response protein YsnF
MTKEDKVRRSAPEGPTGSREPLESLARPDEPVAMVRSEEELVLSTRAVAHERVRLVKRIITETVTTTTEVRREELHVERLPADSGESSAASASADAPQGPSARGGRLRERLASIRRRGPSKPAAGSSVPFAQQSFDVVLMEEQVVVNKRVVPRERIRLRKEVVTHQENVAGTVRKEHVALERDLGLADGVQVNAAADLTRQARYRGVDSVPPPA